ncbi:ac52-like protein [Alphabaculovirus altersperidaniae]|uniref:Ac52-like protein n=1 Tax=Spodoptera eridania nucleopolyhedrovirus TaxID=2315721 RepID=A0ABX6TR52_9ABAC|nr:ac52-like protein [Spodoptera eridania nucleopolyhedrovirus]QNV47832.1 ac52-like protein [Spodoptera eridania nucleopolyhedrovirus]
MELIKPFLKYSRLYRSASNKNVCKFIYKLWSDETQYMRNDKNLSFSHLMTNSIEEKCVFCTETIDGSVVGNSVLFCNHCFFPQIGMDEEFATYCLLSVCFYESNINGNDDDETSSQRTVYKQRLKMTWYNYERLGKIYKVSCFKCHQCHHKTDNVGAKFTYFSDNMFCNNCMFPLFNIIIYTK